MGTYLSTNLISHNLLIDSVFSIIQKICSKNPYILFSFIVSLLPYAMILEVGFLDQRYLQGNTFDTKH